jgi:hypothetical protein
MVFPYPDLRRKVAEHVGLLLVVASHHSIRRSKHPERNLFQAFFRSLLVLLGHKRRRQIWRLGVGVSWGCMTPQPAEAQAVRESYSLLRLADARRQPVAALYDGLPRLLCPHVLGRKSGRLHVLCYQFGGSSHSGLPMAPGRMGGWRCLAVERLSQVELRADAWHTEPRCSRQTCIDEIDFDADAQPEEDPQKGQ